MPVDFFVAPQMSCDPLLKPIQCRADIGVESFLKMNHPLFSYHDCGVSWECHHQEIRSFHQKGMSISSYKSDSVSSSNDDP